MFYTETKIIARYQETDQMGIIHHSVYPIWFEAARTDFIKAKGISYSDAEAMGLWLPLREVHATYLVPAKYEDEIVIKTFLADMTKTRLKVGYEVYRKVDMMLLAKGYTLHIFTTPKLKPINLQKHFPKIYEMIIED